MRRVLGAGVAIALSGSLVGCPPRVERGPSAVARAQAPVAVVVGEADALVLTADVRAGWGLDPLDREGLAWLTARALIHDTPVEVHFEPERASFRLVCGEEEATACASTLGDALVGQHLGEAPTAELVAEGIAALGDPEPRYASQEVARTWLFEAHPYGHPARGRRSTLALLQDHHVERFHRRHYVREAMVVTAAGPGAEQAGESLRGVLEAAPTTRSPDLALRRPLPVVGPAVIDVRADTDWAWATLVQPVSPVDEGLDERLRAWGQGAVLHGQGGQQAWIELTLGPTPPGEIAAAVRAAARVVEDPHQLRIAVVSPEPCGLPSTLVEDEGDLDVQATTTPAPVVPLQELFR